MVPPTLMKKSSRKHSMKQKNKKNSELYEVHDSKFASHNPMAAPLEASQFQAYWPQFLRIDHSYLGKLLCLPPPPHPSTLYSDRTKETNEKCSERFSPCFQGTPLAGHGKKQDYFVKRGVTRVILVDSRVNHNHLQMG